MKKSIKNKLVLIILPLFLISIMANTAISTYRFSKEYTEELESKAVVVAKDLAQQLDTILSYGIALENIVGFDKQCQETAGNHDDISQALVIDLSGNILFSSGDPGLKGGTATDIAAQLASEVTTYNDKEEHLHHVIYPLAGKNGQNVGIVVVSYPTAVVRDKLVPIYHSAVLIAALFAVLASLSVLYAINRSVTRPLGQLVGTMKEVSEKGNLEQRVTIESEDEVGELAKVFNRMLKSLKRSEQRIKRLLEVRTQFINQVSHDLRTPLTPIKVILPILREKTKDKLAKDELEHCAVLDRNVEQLSHLVEDTLSISRLDSGKLVFDVKPCSVRELVAECVTNYDYIFKEQQVAVENKVEEQLPKAAADKQRVIEVLNNLMTNAVKFMKPTGEKRIAVEARQRGEMLEVSVSDNGVGIGKEHLKRIFEEFYKADPSRHDAAGSSGLGLAICRRIIEKHGGRIWAESEGLGKGTTVRFTLPAAK